MKDIELERSVEHLERYWSKIQNYAFYLELSMRLILSTSGLLALYQIASGSGGWQWFLLAICSILITHVILPAFNIDGLHSKTSYIQKQWRDLETDIKHAKTKRDLDYCRLKFKDMFSENHGIPVFNRVSDKAIEDMEAYYAE